MTDEIALELYKTYRSEMMENLNLHRATIEHYLTFTVALLAAIVAGATSLPQLPWLALILAFAAVLNCFACGIAISMCDRYYTGVLDRIALVAKLEGYLALSDQSLWQQMSASRPAIPFKQDVTLVPRRWIAGVENYATSATFVSDGMQLGNNLLAKRTFRLVIAINILLVLMLVYFYAQHLYLST
jgi:hypothetical protein